MSSTLHPQYWPKEGSSSVDQQGVELRTPPWGMPKLYWNTEPEVDKMENLVRKVLGLDSGDTCSVSYMAKGSYNKLYNVATFKPGLADTILRVIPPLDPVHKTESEVATLKFLEANTNIPVPRVIAYGLDRDDIGFEWILMTRLSGRPFADVERWIPLEDKVKLIKQLALHLAELFKLRFSMIGSLKLSGGTFLAEETSSLMREQQARKYEVKHVVSRAFFCAKHISLHFNRGPYQTGKEWLEERIRLFAHNQKQTIDRLENAQRFAGRDGPKSTESEEQQDTEQRQPIIQDQHVVEAEDIGSTGGVPGVESVASTLEQDMNSGTEESASETDSEDSDQRALEAQHVYKLASIIVGEIIQEAFGEDSEQRAETTTIYHDDLHEGNVLVDDEGNLTGLVDWECISAVPLWEACQIPSLLDNRERKQSPVKDNYRDYDPTTWSGSGPDPEAEINGGKCITYWEHRNEYHCTVLQQIFLEEMRNICPEWVTIHKRSGLKQNLSFAISRIASELYVGDVDWWIRNLRKGNFEDDLRKRMRENEWAPVNLNLIQSNEAQAMWAMYRLSQRLGAGEMEWNPAMLPLLEGASDADKRAREF